MTDQRTVIGGPYARFVLPVAAISAQAAFVGGLAAVSASRGLLGYDFSAYYDAAGRMLAGTNLYLTAAERAAGTVPFVYPPPFALLMTPVTLLPLDIATSIWTVLMWIAEVIAVAILPVPTRVRWMVLLLAAISWPVVESVTLGQVGPLLLLLFAAGWRWMDRPWLLGIASALGAVIKIQPVVLLIWAVATGRRRAAAIAVGAIVLISLAATAIAGPGAWSSLFDTLAAVSQPTLTANQVGIGRLAFQAGLGLSIAGAIQLLNLGAVAVAVLVALRIDTPSASYVAIVVASQLASPVLRDHYAIVLLLPVAWLLARGDRWPVIIPVALSVPMHGVVPPVAYPVAFWLALLAVVMNGREEIRPWLGTKFGATSGTRT